MDTSLSVLFEKCSKINIVHMITPMRFVLGVRAFLLLKWVNDCFNTN